MSSITGTLAFTLLIAVGHKKPQESVRSIPIASALPKVVECMQVDLIPYDSSTSSSRQPSLQRAATPSAAPSHPPQPTPQTSSSTNSSHSSQGASSRASDTNATGIQGSSGGRSSSGDQCDDASSLTTRNSGLQHGIQVPGLKAPKGPRSSSVANGGGGRGSKGSWQGRMRAEGRQTSEELPDVTGRQSDHTNFDATGVRQINTAGRRVFGSSP